MHRSKTPTTGNEDDAAVATSIVRLFATHWRTLAKVMVGIVCVIVLMEVRSTSKYVQTHSSSANAALLTDIGSIGGGPGGAGAGGGETIGSNKLRREEDIVDVASSAARTASGGGGLQLFGQQTEEQQQSSTSLGGGVGRSIPVSYTHLPSPRDRG